MAKEELCFKTHTANLLAEIFTCPGTAILFRPIQIFSNTLVEVANRCSQINDPILNELMCRLTLYAIADPVNKNEYAPKRVNEIQKIAKEYKETTK